MSDPYNNYPSGLESPASEVYEITPDDGSDLTVTVRALSVAASGNVRVTTISGTTATIYMAAGAPFPVRASKVFATGTTATGIVGLV